MVPGHIKQLSQVYICGHSALGARAQGALVDPTCASMWVVLADAGPAIRGQAQQRQFAEPANVDTAQQTQRLGSHKDHAPKAVP